MSTIDTGLGWSCNDSYYKYDANTNICAHSGHWCKKRYDGAAIAIAFQYNNGLYNAALISTNKNFAELTGNTTNSDGEYINTFDYLGLSWHAWLMYNSVGLSSFSTNNVPFYPTQLSHNYPPVANDIQNFLTAADVQIVAETKMPTINYVKTFVEGIEAETVTRVNANKASIGTLSSLTTTDKTSTVSAINEINSVKQPKTMSAAITVDGTPQTTVENAIGAINSFTSAKISDIYANLGIYDNDVYGLQVDYENYIYTRLAGAAGKSRAFFDTVAPWSGMRRCNLADDGTVNAYYGDNDYIEDGSNGQVMVEIPRFYYKMVPLKLDPIGDSVGGYHTRKANYYISATKYEGFKTHPAFVKPDGTERDKVYISAYEASIYDVSASSYILDDAQIADFTATTGDKLSSIANAKPASGLTQNLTRANSEILATNRGTGWHCMDVKAASAVQLLFMIEYGTLNSQNAIGRGVVDKTSGTGNEAEITGTTSSLGNSTGMASGTNGLVSVSYRGVENFYGNIWKFVEGINLWGDGTLRGGQPYICDNYNFTEDTKTGYTASKFTITNVNGFISAFGYDPDFDWLFLPSECINADSNYPVGDYDFATSDLNGYRTSLLGSYYWSVGVRAGAFCWDLDEGAGYRTRSIGARLIYVS